MLQFILLYFCSLPNNNTATFVHVHYLQYKRVSKNLDFCRSIYMAAICYNNPITACRQMSSFLVRKRLLQNFRSMSQKPKGLTSSSRWSLIYTIYYIFYRASEFSFWVLQTSTLIYPVQIITYCVNPNYILHKQSQRRHIHMWFIII